MKKIYLSVLPLLVVLYGCHQSMAAPRAASSTPTQAAATPMPTAPASQPAASSQPETTAPAPAVAQPAVTQPAAAPTPVAAAPVATAPAPAPVTVAAAPAAATPAAKADSRLSDAEARSLAQKSGCFACHLIDKKLVGPAWKDIAAKYRGQKDAEAQLAAKVAKGGSGVWGAVPMPPNAPKVSEANIKALVHFILGLK